MPSLLRVRPGSRDTHDLLSGRLGAATQPPTSGAARYSTRSMTCTTLSTHLAPSLYSGIRWDAPNAKWISSCWDRWGVPVASGHVRVTVQDVLWKALY